MVDDLSPENERRSVAFNKKERSWIGETSHVCLDIMRPSNGETFLEFGSNPDGAALTLKDISNGDDDELIIERKMEREGGGKLLSAKFNCLLLRHGLALRT